VVAFLLYSREIRGGNLKARPRKVERLVLWKLGNRRIHIHHAYWAVIPLMIRYWIGDVYDIALMIAIILVVSDLIFHWIAHRNWDDPLWD